MKKILFLLLFTPALLSAQKLDMELLKNIKPRSIGPAGMAGRITAIDVVTDDPDVIYVGSASGGLWKSTSGGIKWDPIFEDQTTASIGAVAIQQSNPSVIWVGTGEGNPRNSLNGGDGIYRSLDGGKSWKKMGLAKTRHIHRIIIHPNDPNTVYVGAIGSPWGAHQERGVYKTTDGGLSWDKILYTNERSGTADLIMDPTNPNKLIAAMWEHDRSPWFFKSGGEGSGLYVTYDGGLNWDKRTNDDGLPKGELGRIGLAIAPSEPNIIYALIESKDNALYRSEDGGFKWKMINTKDDIGNRPFYYSDIYVDPVNENRVYSIFTYVNVSEDGGKSFKQLMPAYYTTRGVHPDHHAWWIHPYNPNYMIDGNDGGLNITRDRGKTWRFVQTIPVAQFYHIAVDNELPYNVYGGMQDNGSWAGPAYAWKAQGIRNDYWQEISFGDGFDVLPDPGDSRYGISASQQGYAGIYDRETGNYEYIRPTNPKSDVELRFNWNAAMNRDPFDPNTVYFGSQFVHKSTDGGQTWDIISDDLTTNDPEKQKQGDSGGLTMDATGAENFCTVLVIEPSPIQKDLIWAGTDDGRIHWTSNGGNSWTEVTGNVKEMPRGAWITQIKASNKRPGEALLVVNDYRRFNYEPYAFRTRDYGQTWERIVDGSDVVSYALCIIEDPVESNLLFLGTDDGLYMSIDGASTWTKWTEGFPTTNAMDLVIHPREHDLIIGTFGRAAWVIDDIRPLREIAARGKSILDNRLELYEPPVGYITATQQATGTRFGGDAIFNGENRPRNAMLTYSINRPDKKKNSDEAAKKKKGKKDDETKEEKTNGVKYDSLLIEIFDADNQLIRTIKQKAPKENGMHRTYWDMGEKGIQRERRKSGNRNNNSGDPSGNYVIPGDYKVKFTFGDQSDSTTVQVAYDPKLGLTQEILIAQYEAINKMEEKGELAYTAIRQLKEALEISKKLKVELKSKDKEEFKSQIELCDSVEKVINGHLDSFFGKEDDRQGITRGTPESVLSYYSSAYFYTAGAMHAPTRTEVELTERFENKLTEVLEEVNAYFDQDWKDFRATMEQVDLNPFKNFERVE